jgi:6-phosphofructokinase 1
LGAACVDALLAGKRGIAVGQVNDEIAYTPLREAVERRKDINRQKYELAKVLAL